MSCPRTINPNDLAKCEQSHPNQGAELTWLALSSYLHFAASARAMEVLSSRSTTMTTSAKGASLAASGIGNHQLTVGAGRPAREGAGTTGFQACVLKSLSASLQP